MTWLDAFLWTLALETPIYAWFLAKRTGARTFFPTALGINAFTHPIVWHTVPRFSDYDVGLWTMESFAVIAEAAIIAVVLAHAGRGLASGPVSSPSATALRALIAALAANAFSAIVGPRLIDLVAGP